MTALGKMEDGESRYDYCRDPNELVGSRDMIIVGTRMNWLMNMNSKRIEQIDMTAIWCTKWIVMETIDNQKRTNWTDRNRYGYENQIDVCMMGSQHGSSQTDGKLQSHNTISNLIDGEPDG